MNIQIPLAPWQYWSTNNYRGKSNDPWKAKWLDFPETGSFWGHTPERCKFLSWDTAGTVGRMSVPWKMSTFCRRELVTRLGCMAKVANGIKVVKSADLEMRRWSWFTGWVQCNYKDHYMGEKGSREREETKEVEIWEGFGLMVLELKTQEGLTSQECNILWKLETRKNTTLGTPWL